jgi:UDP-N-acetylglucosamine--N-acetylmuramyl-(pentapeptide) pyrophosphoryl-undecaprenol N-acetylglucosamine transferase
MKTNKIIISGGGTGGHIFPAIAIANEIKRRNPSADILFVGALGKMEMEKVPQAGYNIVGLPITGFQRRLTFSNFVLPFKLIFSLVKAFFILKKFKPQVVVGVGGYASGPMLRIASMVKVPTVVQEQNSFPGKTNRILSKVVSKMCVAYHGLETFFPKDKIVLTGNPVRNDMVNIEGKTEKALEHFYLDATKKTILIIGGSLGARTLNESLMENIDLLIKANMQVIWQCGKFYYPNYAKQQAELKAKGIHLHEFIKEMDLAYAAADVIISRAGAMSVSELCIIQKPTILVPSPNVSDDHQTHNAKALGDAVVLITDKEAKTQLIPASIALVREKEKGFKMAQKLHDFAIPNASELIANEIEKLIV